MNSFAPIALFVYKRPSHTNRTLEALQANENAGKHEVFIFADGPRSERDQAAVNETRAICKKKWGFREVHVVERAQNLGLAKSVITGISEILAKSPQVIVLEDDLVTSPKFLHYMQSGLDRYAADPRVASIHGYCYPAKNLPESFFLRGADCWGWATWPRAWEKFRHDPNGLLNELREKNLQSRFDFEGTYPYMEMLESQAKGSIDSWAIRWHASAFLQNMLTLYPGRSLVSNIGLDGSGSHSGVDDRWHVEVSESEPSSWPDTISENEPAREQLKRYFVEQMPARKRLKYVLSKVRGWITPAASRES